MENSQSLLELFEFVEEIRGLSFCVDQSAEQIARDSKRVEELSQEVATVAGLRTVFEQKSAAVTHTLEKIKTLID